MAIINPSPKSLRELLTGKKYKVPVYQRCYSWSIDEVQELWNDLMDNDPPYFLGILLLRRDKGNEKTYEVVDGQQRLATLMLLIRAAVEILEGAREKGKMEKYLFDEDLGTSDVHFILTLNYRDNDTFKTLLNDTHRYLPATWIRKSISWKRLEETKKFFHDRLIRLGEDEIIKFIRDKVLELQLIDVHLESDDDVYTFFETLNDRGMDLSIADLVKNRVCGLSNDPSEPANKVDRITDLLGPGKMKPFLLHYCWALTENDPPPPVKKLMDWYDEIIKKEGNEFLIKLEEFASYYSELIDPKKSKSSHRDSLTFLKALGATRCYPLLLVGRKYLDPKEFTRLCQAVELLTVRWSTITQTDAKKLEKIYLKLAKEIREGTDIDDIIEKIRNQSKDISDNQFEAFFREYEPANMQIARYLLLKIDDFLNGGKSVGLDWDKLTLDHIIARKLSTDEIIDNKDKLGNMTLLSEINNKSLGNKPYSEKRNVYLKEDRLRLPRDLAKEYGDFNGESIKKYQEYLASIALKVWNPSALR